MTFIGNIGDGSPDCPQIVPLNVFPGATVTVTNLAGATISYDSNLDGSADGTITATSSQGFTVPTHLVPGNGVTTIQISGANY